MTNPYDFGLECGIVEDPTGNIVRKDAIGSHFIELYAICGKHYRAFYMSIPSKQPSETCITFSEHSPYTTIAKALVLCRAITESLPGNLANQACECMIAEHNRLCKHGAAPVRSFKPEPCQEHGDVK